MIRNFELFCKLKIINISELELFSNQIASFCPDLAVCPFCQAKGALKKHGSYTRDLIHITNGTVMTEILTVPRYICACGHTHAILPACLIPHGSYSLFFILTVLHTYFLRSNTVQDICDTFKIAPSTLYDWIRLFHTHKSLWLGTLSHLESSNIDFLTLLWDELHFLQRFFTRMAFSFLQGVSLASASHRSPPKSLP